MSELVHISGAAFRAKLVGLKLSDIDRREKPRLHWIAISELRVDHRYQRKLEGKVSAKAVLTIAIEFSWAKFAPVVVAESDEGFAIVDGQHRTTAAALRGIRDVPCLIMQASVAEQAEAFAAINGGATPVSSLQIFAAKVTAGNKNAMQLRDACAEAGVTICRYPVPANEMKVGWTLAATNLGRQLARYGRETLVSALSCITKTGDGNIGMVRAQVVEALCSVINGEPAWGGAALVDAMQSFDFFKAFADARMRALQERAGVYAPLVEIISEHLEQTFAQAAE
jgi:hypothetical protein